MGVPAVMVEPERSKVNYELTDRMGEINNENPGKERNAIDCIATDCIYITSNGELSYGVPWV